jgi:hypothetical protein
VFEQPNAIHTHASSPPIAHLRIRAAPDVGPESFFISLGYYSQLPEGAAVVSGNFSKTRPRSSDLSVLTTDGNTRDVAPLILPDDDAGCPASAHLCTSSLSVRSWKRSATIASRAAVAFTVRRAVMT